MLICRTLGPESIVGPNLDVRIRFFFPYINSPQEEPKKDGLEANVAMSRMSDAIQGRTRIKLLL